MRELAEGLDLRLIWYTPTRYCRINPVELELGPGHCTAGRYNLCVEPDGAVIPCQSYYERAGNLLTESTCGVQPPGDGPPAGATAAAARMPGLPRAAALRRGCPLELEGKPVACPDAMSNG